MKIKSAMRHVIDSVRFTNHCQRPSTPTQYLSRKKAENTFRRAWI